MLSSGKNKKIFFTIVFAFFLTTNKIMSKQIIIYYHIFIFLTVFLFVGNTWHVSASGAKTSKETQSSLEIKVDYSDVSLFYSVIEKAQKEGKEITGEYMYKNYIQKSSDGLKNGYAKNRTDVFPKKGAVIDYSVYEKKMKPLLPFFIKNKNIFMNKNLLLEKDLQQLSEAICTFLGPKLCSRLKNSTVYFSISGAFNMGGTIFEKGVFIDVSMIYDSNIDYITHPNSSMNPAEHLVDKKSIESLIAHEFFHVFQISMHGNSRERKSGKVFLIEGGADFFAANIVEDLSQLKHNQEKYMEQDPEKYAEFFEDIKEMEEKQEKWFYIISQSKHNQEKYMEQDPEKYAEFLEDRKKMKEKQEKWFYNRDTKEVLNSVYPPDLGYYIGKKITQKFFEEEIKTQSRETVLTRIARLDISDVRIEKIIKELSE